MAKIHKDCGTKVYYMGKLLGYYCERCKRYLYLYEVEDEK